jgi:hypothetical protein
MFSLALVMLLGAPRETYSLRSLLEAMPRQPEKDDNELAWPENREWLAKKVKGKHVQFNGKVGGVAARTEGQVKGFNIGCNLQFGQWRDFRWSISFGGFFPRSKTVDFSKVHPGDAIQFEGEVATMDVRWASQRIETGMIRDPNNPQTRTVRNGTIRIGLTNCRVIAITKAEETPPEPVR